MNPEALAFDGAHYWVLFSVLILARGMDFLSTWIATPTLLLEANPLARRLGWRNAILLNLLVCFAFAGWVLPAIVIATSSALVAARNFQSAWLMRSLGEAQYRQWILARMDEAPAGLFLFCLIAQGLLVGGIGIGLICFSGQTQVVFAVGVGVVTYATAVVFYSLLASRRSGRSHF